MQLQEYINHRLADGRITTDIGMIISHLADAAIAITQTIRVSGIEKDLGAETGAANADGDEQKALDVMAEEIIITHLKNTATSHILSEEQDAPVATGHDGKVMVAIDPLDGSSNIAVNVTVGTIFSLMPRQDAPVACAGRDQLAAGFFTYGPQTTLILAFASDTAPQCFVLDERNQQFIAMGGAVEIPPETNEYAINAAYSEHWFAPVREWMGHVLAGHAGAYGKPYRMRWVGSMVADAWRIFQRGGVFLYPGDNRKGYADGRLRLVYEANPISFLVEKAGGMAINGCEDILDLQPQSLHQRTPVILGAKQEMTRLKALHLNK